MIIDLHAHVVPPRLADALRRRDTAPRISGNGEGRAEVYHMPDGVVPFSVAFTDIATRIGFLDRLGIDVQLLSLPGLFGIDYLPADQSAPLVRAFNDDLSAQCRSYPTRLLGLAALPLADIAASVLELRRAVDSLGLIGAILPNNAFLSVSGAQRLAPLFAYAQEKGLHLFIHPGWRSADYPVAGHAGSEPVGLRVPRRALDTQHHVAQAMVTLLYSDFLDAYPDITLHMANLGGTFPMVVERMDHTVLTRFPGAELPSSKARRIIVDCSSLGGRAIECAAAFYGADHIVLGTDTPIFSAEWTLNEINSSSLSLAEKDGILAGTAKQLLKKWL